MVTTGKEDIEAWIFAALSYNLYCSVNSWVGCESREFVWFFSYTYIQLSVLWQTASNLARKACVHITF